MKKLLLVGEAIIEFIITYASIVAGIIVLPLFMTIMVNVFSGNFANLGLLLTALVCAFTLSASMFYRHLKRINVITAKQI